jgi:hypothetical protein
MRLRVAQAGICGCQVPLGSCQPFRIAGSLGTVARALQKLMHSLVLVHQIILHSCALGHLETRTPLPLFVAACARQLHLLLKMPVREVWLGVKERDAAKVPVRHPRPLRRAVIVRKGEQSIVCGHGLVKDARLHGNEAHALERRREGAWLHPHAAGALLLERHHASVRLDSPVA